ncbi:hypothetical protein EYF80_035535 [Liparis tanakae]|uniref:Uncharacterized protein n=1 Tax=Liparis tanakae TaxID=230148 RepID=A0A4Z2GLZ2_9TELE|nr:hypothetical protein EYF80_035535 [Liparis tanakae]
MSKSQFEDLFLFMVLSAFKGGQLQHCEGNTKRSSNEMLSTSSGVTYSDTLSRVGIAASCAAAHPAHEACLQQLLSTGVQAVQLLHGAWEDKHQCKVAARAWSQPDGPVSPVLSAQLAKRLR